jgi:CHAT domain-containing protein
MSLWSVPSIETSDLITLFYENWLQGLQSKPQALHNAELTMRDRIIKEKGRDIPIFGLASFCLGNNGFANWIIELARF